MSVIMRRIALVMILLWTSSTSQAYDITAEQLIARFQEVRNLFIEKNQGGYEIDSAIALIPDLVSARQTRDWQRFIDVLEQIATELENSSLPGPPPPPPPPADIFNFGVKNARPDIAPDFSDLGANWIGIGLVHWELVEPAAPAGSVHTYDWTALDNLVNQWQTNGYANVHMVISPRNTWAAVSPPSSDESATPIQAEYIDDFGLMVRSMVERYDGDGFNDAPDLVAPIKYYEIGQEMQHDYYWEGTAEDYRQLLEAGYNGVKTADSESLVILSGINMASLFDDSPPPDVLEARLQNLPPELASALSFIQTSFTYDQWFDIVEFHYNFDYKGAVGMVAWLREQMAANGYDKPIWIGDAAGGPFIDNYMVRTPQEADELYNKLSDPNHPEHDATVAWYEREQALGLVKKFVVTMELGVEGMIFSNLKDWPGYGGGRTWEFQGLKRDDSTDRPAYETYTALVDGIGTMTTIEKVSTGSGSAYAYKLTDGQNTVYVLWSSVASESLDLAVNAQNVTVKSPVPNEVTEEEKQVQNGNVNLLLTEVPIFVELGVN